MAGDGRWAQELRREFFLSEAVGLAQAGSLKELYSDRTTPISQKKDSLKSCLSP